VLLTGEFVELIRCSCLKRACKLMWGKSGNESRFIVSGSINLFGAEVSHSLNSLWTVGQ
jgi:hypothetical protein